VTKVIVKRTTEKDIDELIANIRYADRVEIESASGRPYHEIICDIEEHSEMWSGFVDDELVVVFGMHIVSALTGKAIPWLISTNNVEKHSRTFLRYCKPVFKKLCINLNSLVNYVHDDNHLAKTWLKWLGFKLQDPAPYGAKQELFCKFTKELNYV